MFKWRGARAVERGGLENRCTGNGTVSSNLTPAVFPQIFKSVLFVIIYLMALDQNIFFITAGVLGVLALVTLGLVVRLELRLKKVFRGKKAGDLESLMGDFAKALDNFDRWSKNAHNRMDNFDKELVRSARHVGMVRFNPFRDAGGDQSSAVAILDDNRNGVVLSSIYGRDSSRMYAKPVIKGNSQYQLSDEEKQAISKAITRES